MPTGGHNRWDACLPTNTDAMRTGTGRRHCRPWMGNAWPIAVSADIWRGGPTDQGDPDAMNGTITDLVFENITAQSENGIFVSGRVGGVSHVAFTNVHLVIQQLPANNASFGPCPAHNCEACLSLPVPPQAAVCDLADPPPSSSDEPLGTISIAVTNLQCLTWPRSHTLPPPAIPPTALM